MPEQRLAKTRSAYQDSETLAKWARIDAALNVPPEAHITRCVCTPRWTCIWCRTKAKA